MTASLVPGVHPGFPAFTAKRVFAETPGQWVGPAHQERRDPRACKETTRRERKGPRENQDLRETAVRAGCRTSLRDYIPPSNFPVKGGPRVTRVTSEASANAEAAERMDCPVFLAATASRERKETLAKKDPGAKGAKRDPKVQPERKARRESQVSPEKMAFPATREHMARKEGLEALANKDHRAHRDRQSRLGHPSRALEVLRAWSVTRDRLDATARKEPPVLWATEERWALRVRQASREPSDLAELLSRASQERMVFPDFQACVGVRAHRALKALPASPASRVSQLSDPQEKMAGQEETDGQEFPECGVTPDQQVTRAYLGAACGGWVPMAQWACLGLRATRAFPVGQAGRV